MNVHSTKKGNMNKRQESASKTKEIILKTASQLFAEKGFEGISISQIAKESKVNQSLIYHYFESKEDLWKSVKNYFFQSSFEDEKMKLNPYKGFKYNLEQIIYKRFEFYEKNPGVVRMMTWQRLETSNKKLFGGTPASPEKWKEVFIKLQNQGEINEHINIDTLILFILSLIEGALIEDHQEILKEKNIRISYLDLIIKSCLITFGKSNIT